MERQKEENRYSTFWNRGINETEMRKPRAYAFWPKESLFSCESSCRKKKKKKILVWKRENRDSTSQKSKNKNTTYGKNYTGFVRGTYFKFKG